MRNFYWEFSARGVVAWVPGCKVGPYAWHQNGGWNEKRWLWSLYQPNISNMSHCCTKQTEITWFLAKHRIVACASRHTAQKRWIKVNSWWKYIYFSINFISIKLKQYSFALPCRTTKAIRDIQSNNVELVCESIRVKLKHQLKP